MSNFFLRHEKLDFSKIVSELFESVSGMAKCSEMDANDSQPHPV